MDSALGSFSREDTGAHPSLSQSGFESIQFKIASWIERGCGSGDITWDTEEVRDVKLSRLPFAYGACKLVYVVMIDGKRWVAKRYAVIPEGGFRSDVPDVNAITRNLPISKNASHPQSEFRVQKSGSYFLDEFYKLARKNGATVSKGNFQFPWA
ncbi:hypothetical protein K435DRAFT_662969 [Dendrothele bispora CBS 962.96]|uniref:Uncharacterized protein n=1 Tax=Dendrothele bispora (strain CBS 962.96) TaxID=1314807 RepID=A0A4S8M6E8_DENBC|nr:hypothetical protein K435DRAFT_662969 [Dendrothele bispora CBS 962.96]